MMRLVFGVVYQVLNCIDIGEKETYECNFELSSVVVVDCALKGMPIANEEPIR